MTGLAATVVMIRRRKGHLLVVAPEGITVDELSRLLRASLTADEVQALRDYTDQPPLSDVPESTKDLLRDAPLGPHVWVDADGICRRRCATAA